MRIALAERVGGGSTREQVYLALRGAIISAELEPGRRLSENELGERFGVSRTPVREALVQLEAEGLVRIEPHKGAVVAGAALSSIEETFELRELLEPMLLTHSAPHLTEADYRAIDAVLKEYSAELRSQNVRRWGELNTKLHAMLYARAGRPQTQAIVDKLLAASDRFTRLQLLLTDGLERAEQEHAEIARLCRGGAYAAAATALAQHIRAVKEALVALAAKR